MSVSSDYTFSAAVSRQNSNYSGGCPREPARTQAAASSGTTLRVRLLDAAGQEVGVEFHAQAIIVDNSTRLDHCIPRVQAGRDILVSQLSDGTWYIVNPTFCLMDTC